MKLTDLLAFIQSLASKVQALISSRAALQAQVADLQNQLANVQVPQDAVDALNALQADIDAAG